MRFVPSLAHLSYLLCELCSLEVAKLFLNLRKLGIPLRSVRFFPFSSDRVFPWWQNRFPSSVERTFARHLDAMLHPQLTPRSLFLGDTLECFAKSSGTYGLPYIVGRTTGKRQDHNRQGDNHRHTHTEHAAEQQDSQQRVHNTNSQMVQYNVPMQRLI